MEESIQLPFLLLQEKYWKIRLHTLLTHGVMVWRSLFWVKCLWLPRIQRQSYPTWWYFGNEYKVTSGKAGGTPTVRAVPRKKETELSPCHNASVEFSLHKESTVCNPEDPQQGGLSQAITLVSDFQSPYRTAICCSNPCWLGHLEGCKDVFFLGACEAGVSCLISMVNNIPFSLKILYSVMEETFLLGVYPTWFTEFMKTVSGGIILQVMIQLHSKKVWWLWNRKKMLKERWNELLFQK